MKLAEWIALGVALVFLAPDVWGRQGTVLTKDGRSFEGEIGERADVVSVTREELTIDLPRAEISEIVFDPSLEDEYRQRLLNMQDGDLAGHYELATWSKRQKLYDLMEERVEYILVHDGEHEGARLLRQWNQSRLARASSDSPDAADEPDSDDDTGKPLTDAERPFLSENDIQAIRRKEVLRGERISVNIPRSVTDAFWTKIRDSGQYSDKRQFMRLLPYEKLSAMISERDTDKLLREVKIKADPRVLKRYRSKIQPMMLRNCATSACHGGSEAGTLWLHTEASKSERVVYTNFYLLQSHEFGGSMVIDRDRPDESLLLVFGLPDRHPGDIPKVFRNQDTINYRRIRDWITSLSKDPRYGIVLPGGGKAKVPDPKDEDE